MSLHEQSASLPEVCFSDEDDVRHLHLGTPWIQGSMRMSAPFRLELEYVQRMMAWLLFTEPDEVSAAHAMQLGLGAGALTKFCRKCLHMRTTAIELNPQVYAVCRSHFRLPANDKRLQVILADAEQEIRQPHWIGTVDALQVDLYDDDAAAPALDSVDFYAACRALLTEAGCMTVNLFGRSCNLERSRGKIAEAFGEDALWSFRPTREGNTVVLAQREPGAIARPLLRKRAETIQTRWGLPAVKWLRVLQGNTRSI